MRGDDLEPERWNVESQRGKSSGSDGSPHARDPRPGAHEVNLEAYVRSPERLRANPEASTGKPKRQDANPKGILRNAEAGRRGPRSEDRLPGAV